MAAYNVRAAAPTLTGIDLGAPSNPGSVTTAADGKITVVGGGSDIWNASDAGYYAYFKQTGDFDYVMKVESLVGNTGDGGWSKVELMVRQEETAGAGPQGPDRPPGLERLPFRSTGRARRGRIPQPEPWSQVGDAH